MTILPLLAPHPPCPSSLPKFPLFFSFPAWKMADTQPPTPVTRYEVGFHPSQHHPRRVQSLGHGPLIRPLYILRRFGDAWPKKPPGPVHSRSALPSPSSSPLARAALYLTRASRSLALVPVLANFTLA